MSISDHPSPGISVDVAKLESWAEQKLRPSWVSGLTSLIDTAELQCVYQRVYVYFGAAIEVADMSDQEEEWCGTALRYLERCEAILAALIKPNLIQALAGAVGSLFAPEAIAARIDRFTAQGDDLSSSFSSKFSKSHPSFVKNISMQLFAIHQQKEAQEK
jgi:hypothetical protein